MALSQNKDLVQQRAKLEMAGYDRKIASSYYYPKVSALGTYQHTGGGFALVDDSSIPQFSGLGGKVQEIKAGLIQDIQGILQGDPQLAQQLMQNPGFQQAMAKLNNSDVAAAVTQIGASVDKAIEDATHRGAV